jgi:phosphopantothenoylcysteine decarboxylase / phosphopantothenate---cysteine ligase
MQLAGKKILIGITGSIAAYKTPLLIRQLVKQGATVKIVATKGALQFVTPIVLNTLSQQEIVTDLTTEGQWNNHVHLGRWADLFLIAPLSCNTLAKMANGICDNAFMAVYLSCTCPVIASPAMDEDMWLHASTKENITKITQHGVTVLPPEAGSLASGLTGVGRMPEVEDLYKKIEAFFFANKPFAGKKILITAGPTYQPIDPVRFIGNRSSGKMGVAIAAACVSQGAHVILVYGPGTATVPNNIQQLIKVETAEEMYNACIANFTNCDIAIMSAAVADYTPQQVANEKIKKSGDELTIALAKTKDILASLGAQKKTHQLLVGFALETNNEEQYALGKLEKKNADIIILNSMNDKGAGFAIDTNRITIYSRNKEKLTIETAPKTEIAEKIVNFIHTY